jgi:hypothetical protein
MPGTANQKLTKNWAKVVLLFLPLSIAALDLAAIVSEHLQPETEKAIRLVKESASRKENFTVEHYLYSILQGDRGDDFKVEGWRANRQGGPETPITVEFDYTKGGVRHALLWEVDLKAQKVKPITQEADYISWD